MPINCAENHLYLHVSYQADESAANVQLDAIARAAIEAYRGTEYLEKVTPAKLEDPAPYAVQPIGTSATCRLYDVFYVDASGTVAYAASVAIRKLYGYRTGNIDADAMVYDRHKVGLPTFRPMYPHAA